MPHFFATYDPEEVIVTAGSADIDGFAPGNFITITMDSDQFNTVVGVRGDVVRSKTSNLSATITIRLLASSASNDLLSTIYNLDQNAPNGAGVFPLAIRDSATGRATYLAANAWINKAPDVNFDAQDATMEWQIKAARLIRFDGGRV